jgi:hypothetical protein
VERTTGGVSGQTRKLTRRQTKESFSLDLRFEGTRVSATVRTNLAKEIEWKSDLPRVQTEGRSMSISSEKQPVFLRRINEDGVFESICPACFDVVSTQTDEADVAREEAGHRCSEMVLKETLDYFRSHLAVEGRSSKR